MTTAPHDPVGGHSAGDEGIRSERGSAVVDFVMVSMLIVALLMAVLQVAVYVHVRNVVTASAQAGARYAATADVDSAAGAPRTVEVVARATTSTVRAAPSDESTSALAANRAPSCALAVTTLRTCA